MNANNANARKSAVAKLVGTGKIASQSDLVKALKRQGIIVTQGTASRDLEDIGVLKLAHLVLDVPNQNLPWIKTSPSTVYEN